LYYLWDHRRAFGSGDDGVGRFQPGSGDDCMVLFQLDLLMAVGYFQSTMMM